jgi:hypothetical protein
VLFGVIAAPSFPGHEEKITFRNTIDWSDNFVPDPAARDEIGSAAARLYRFA